jgi:hypothetical protein
MVHRRTAHDLANWYARLLAEQAYLEGRAKQLKAAIQELPGVEARLEAIPDLLEATTRIVRDFDPSWDPSTVVAKRMRPQRADFDSAVIRRALFELLHRSARPLTQPEMVDIISAQIKPRFSEMRTRYDVAAKVTAMLGYYRRCGLLKGEGRPKRWSFTPRAVTPARHSVGRLVAPRVVTRRRKASRASADAGRLPTVRVPNSL